MKGRIEVGRPFFERLESLLRGFSANFSSTMTEPAPRQRWEMPLLIGLVALGALLRFWGLGGWGLENDEETMAMPTLHILRDGMPILPSGMIYVRGIAQLYMMAASVKVFGPSEWALRIPSVICGLALIPLAYVYGRRFLNATWNMGFVAVAACLPAFIADSQEARMYIFLLAGLALYTILLFSWERTGRDSRLVAAVVVMLVTLQFHTLAVFGAFLVFFPALLSGSIKALGKALAAFLAILAGYNLISSWIASFYPPRPPSHGVALIAEKHVGGFVHLDFPLLVYFFGALVAVGLAWLIVRGSMRMVHKVVIGCAAFAGLTCAMILFYHVAALLVLITAILLWRNAERPLARMSLLVVPLLLLAAVQLYLLHRTGIYPGRKVIGAMVGLPSIWPFFRMMPYTLGGFAVAILGALTALRALALRRTIDDYWLFLLMGLWVPVFLIGLFAWNVEQRYTEFALLPVLVCALAWLQRSVRRWPVAASFIAAVVLIDPMATARVVNAGYTIHPDHKGAAEFIRSMHPGPDDLLIAEDVNQQTYYLGKVDYWVISNQFAASFVEERDDGTLRDIYTGTRVITNGRQFEQVIREHPHGRIFVIGSGEQQEDGRQAARGDGISEVLRRDFREIHTGRDRLTKVWILANRPAEPDTPEGR